VTCLWCVRITIFVAFLILTVQPSFAKCLPKWPSLDRKLGPVVELSPSNDRSSNDGERVTRTLLAMRALLHRLDTAHSAALAGFDVSRPLRVAMFDVVSIAGLAPWPAPMFNVEKPTALIYAHRSGSQSSLVGLQYAVEGDVSGSFLDRFVPLSAFRWAHISNRCRMPSVFAWTLVVFPNDSKLSKISPLPTRATVNLWSNTVMGTW
jgi:hypothetical protein